MATHLLSRSLPRTLSLSSFLFRSIFTTSATATKTAAYSTSSFSSASLFRRLRPLTSAAVVSDLRTIAHAETLRGFSTRATSSSLNDPNPNWTNRPPKETILLDGCDFEHWLVVVEKPEGEPTRDEIIDKYIKTLAQVVGSEEEARMKIYSVSTRCYFAFGALVSEEVSYKLKDVPGVRWVLPDSYLDVKNKDYGGEPFINGQAVPYDPKYHEEWIRNNARANERNRRNDRPRNFDRSRNFETRQRNIQNREVPNMGGAPPPNPGGPPPPNNFSAPPPNNYGGPPNNFSSPPPNSYGGQPNNYAGPQTNSYAGPPPNNYNGPPPNNYSGPPPNNYSVPPPNNYSVPPPNNYSGPPPNNYSGPPTNNYGGPPNNYGGNWSNRSRGAPPHTNNFGGMPPNTGGPPPPPSPSPSQPNNYGGMPQNNMGGMQQYNAPTRDLE